MAIRRSLFASKYSAHLHLSFICQEVHLLQVPRNFFSRSPLLNLSYLCPVIPPEMFWFALKGDPGTAFRITCCLLPSEAPWYVSPTPYSHDMTIRIKRVWHSTFFCSGILNKQNNNTDKRLPVSLKHTWKDPCGQGPGSVWHSVEVSDCNKLLALPLTSQSQRNHREQRSDSSSVGTNTVKFWQTWPSSSTWFWHVTSFPFEGFNEITPLYKLQPPSTPQQTPPTQNQSRGRA